MVLIVGKFHLEYILAIKMEIGMLTGQKSLQKLQKVSKISNFQENISTIERNGGITNSKTLILLEK